jgi:hypothetical protein
MPATTTKVAVGSPNSAGIDWVDFADSALFSVVLVEFIINGRQRRMEKDRTMGKITVR